MPKKNTKSETRSRGRVIAYTRVSTEKQADQGLSLESQRARLEKYASVMGLEIVAFQQDSASASSLDRPGLQAALNDIERGGADGLLIVKLDRLTRSVRDLAVLMEVYFADHALISVSENIDTRSTAAGRMMLNMLTTIAQWEREAIGERTAAVMQHMKASGHFHGRLPAVRQANLVDGELVESEDEQTLIIRARACRAAGMSLRATAITIGNNPRTGRAFSASQIAGML
jgi:site-specific DNA recombinase